MEKRYMMNTRDLKIVELQRLLEEDEDYSLEELSKASDYKPRTLAKKLLIILNTVVREPVLADYSYIVKIFPYISEILQKNEHLEFENLVPIIICYSRYLASSSSRLMKISFIKDEESRTIGQTMHQLD